MIPRLCFPFWGRVERLLEWFWNSEYAKRKKAVLNNVNFSVFLGVWTGMHLK
jgi:hypothetical protein